MSEWTPPGYVTLGKAIDDVGRMLFPKTWTGTEWETSAQQWAKYVDRMIRAGEDARSEALRLYVVNAPSRLKEATSHLRTLLAEGEIGVGVLGSDGVVRSELWMEFWCSDSALSVLATGKSNSFPVLLRSTDVENCLRPRGTSASEGRARQWFENKVKEGPKEMSHQEYFREANRRFGVTRTQFDRIWVSAPDEWKQPGIKVKRPTKTSH